MIAVHWVPEVFFLAMQIVQYTHNYIDLKELQTYEGKQKSGMAMAAAATPMAPALQYHWSACIWCMC